MKKIILSFVCTLIANFGIAGSMELHNGWQFRQVGTEQWLPAAVPGCNHLDLLANEKIEDPFWRTNEADLQWIDKEDWEYQTIFNVSPERLSHDRVELYFEGLDTHATVTLNGTEILKADNMFREWRVDVKKHLKPGQNKLYILFRSPITIGLERLENQTYNIRVTDNDQAEHGRVPGDKRVSVFSRKAPYHFGWDWGPRLVSSGIWRPVHLRAWNEARLANLQIVQKEVADAAARYTAVFEVEAEKAAQAELRFAIDGEGAFEKSVSLEPGIHTYAVDFVINNPKLWWSHGLGEPYLYNATAVIKTAKTTDTKTTRIGVRTIKVVRNEDEAGRTFFFELNGVPVFMKGANMVPMDIFNARVTEEKIRETVQAAVDANFNMLRIWGGGIYQSGTFYDVCDEMGILIWQDFMFACNQYPGDEAFLENVRHEAIDNVRRLRNHPSIALWCGNNEMAWFHFKTGAVTNTQQKAYADKFLKIIPDVLKEHDPSRFYWHSSPAASTTHGGRNATERKRLGDYHHWGVWHGKKPYEAYENNIARFMSEYGFQAFPEIRTIKSFSLPEDFGLNTPVMEHHQRNGAANDKIKWYMEQYYRVPEDFETFLYVGQLLQAEAIKYGMEAHRRARPFCMGSLYWQHNDVWPVASWSSVDYYLRWKALHYWARKAFAQQLVSPFKNSESGAIEIHVVNDDLTPVNAVLQMRMLGFDGSTGWSKEIPVQIKANTSAIYFEIPETELLAGQAANNRLLAVDLKQDEKTLATANHYFKVPRYLDLPKPIVAHSIAKVPDGYSITLSTDVLARNVYLSAGDGDYFFSDNYFDILPGQKVTVHLKTDLGEEKLKKVFSLRTLRDTYGDGPVPAK